MMQKTIFGCCAFLLMVSVAPAYDFTGPPTPQKEHAWLKQFAGEWESTSKSKPGPDLAEIVCIGTVKSRMVGEFWVVSEFKTEVVQDFKVEVDGVTGIQTIGYDPTKKKYVGTWIDSMLGHLWKYEGHVDESGKKLILEAEGPNLLTGKLSKYRDTYEFKTSDRIIATTEILGADGKWIICMVGEMKRK